jgi:UDP-2,4-diacetamido-2,4,6-trideoxy-beta-L-altropyranose hydrolase
MPKHFIIRADATERSGMGHLMRCLAIGQALRKAEFSVTFITFCKNSSLQQRLLDQSFQVILLQRVYPDPSDWQTTAKILQLHRNGWVMIDGYHFDNEYQSAIRNQGYPLLVIDDTAHLSHYDCDILVNQNINAGTLAYSVNTNTRKLLGTQYVLLRSIFLNWQNWRRDFPNRARKILVTMGGSDFQNTTRKVIAALEKLKFSDLEIKIVTGALNPHLDELKIAMGKSRLHFHLLNNVKDMAGLMSWADLAISASGSTCWEFCFLKLPFITIIIADNQKEISIGLEEAGAAKNAGWHHKLNTDSLAELIDLVIRNKKIRRSMSYNAEQIVDGLGAQRILDVIQTVS